MNNDLLIINKIPTLFKILDELKENFGFKIITETDLDKKNLDNYSCIVFVTKENSNTNFNEIVFNNFPIKYSNLIQEINLMFIKENFSKNKNFMIGIFNLDLNSKTITLNGKLLRLTEKEMKALIYFKKIKRPVKSSELEQNVWGYNLELETHTVETHIYRLRKKIFNIFGIDNFIISDTEGYLINPKFS